MKLWDNAASPYAFKVRATLYEKLTALHFPVREQASGSPDAENQRKSGV